MISEDPVIDPVASDQGAVAEAEPAEARMATEDLQQLWLAEGGPIGDHFVDVIRRRLVPLAQVRSVLNYLKEIRVELRSARQELDDDDLTIQRLQGQIDRLKAELAEKTSALRAVDPDDTQRRIDRARHEGWEEGVAGSEAELTKLRGETARQQSEINELRASKKKLREALERAKESR